MQAQAGCYELNDKDVADELERVYGDTLKAAEQQRRRKEAKDEEERLQGEARKKRDEDSYA